MILDGRAIADDIYASLSARRANIKRPITLGIIVSGANPVIESFVRIKRRAAERLDIAMERVDLAESEDTASAIAEVKELASRTDSLIVQLPLLVDIDTNATLAAIPLLKDVDAINPDIPESERPVHAPVALAVVEMLNRANVEIAGKSAVVIGAGRLVGAPSAALLRSLGAEVSMFTLDEGSIEDLKDADIIVCGAGNPGFVKPEHIKEGVAIIDAGASELGGEIRGDADRACAEKAAVFTPVPGGVGPVAVALIFRNLLDLVEKAEE
ncbi:MAG: methylenetetrahydrofolate dehydrogenase (NADP+) / methenyltetrahydrofolate cyclohydrolase [Parcubacteria group bacterium Athens0416_74]|nr:MAG: methylenetetrahydrofolate dehydrogenase (NADP+) / methenyltetrahydrofolate cyclohydrolase [Parcubacteria group bacterium Athens0416_74]